MNSRLSRIFGASYDQIAEQHLHALKQAGVSEDQDLDFKQARYTYGDEGKFELAKDVAALANQVGGVIVVGIAEDDLARAAELTPVKVDDDEQRRMQSTIADRVHPMVHGCRVRRVDAATQDGTGYFLIDVPHSELAPHAVRWTGKQHDEKIPYYCYPLRQGTQTVYLTEPQIAARYRNRFALAREQVDRLGALFDTAHRLSGWPMIAIGIVPAVPGLRPLTGDGDSIRHYADHLWKAPASNEGLVMSYGAYTIQRDRVRSVRNTFVVELYTDGRAFALVPLTNRTYANMPVLVRNDLERGAVDLTSLLGQYTAWSGAAGDAVIATWLYGANQVGIDGQKASLPNQRGETTASVDSLAGDAAAVGQIVYPMMRDLEHDMGFWETASLQPDGTFRLPA